MQAAFAADFRIGIGRLRAPLTALALAAAAPDASEAAREPVDFPAAPAVGSSALDALARPPTPAEADALVRVSELEPGLVLHAPLLAPEMRRTSQGMPLAGLLWFAAFLTLVASSVGRIALHQRRRARRRMRGPYA